MNIDDLLDGWFDKMSKENPKKIALELKRRIKVCEDIDPDCRGKSIIDCLKWCKKKQYDLSKLL